jgi:hypothetical protein
VVVPVVLPAGIVIEVTVATSVLLLEMPTNVPPVGAAAVNVIVATDVAPATTLVGFKAMEATAGSAAGGGGGGGVGAGGGGVPPLPGPEESGLVSARFGATAMSFEHAPARARSPTRKSRNAIRRGRKGMGSSGKSLELIMRKRGRFRV